MQGVLATTMHLITAFTSSLLLMSAEVNAYQLQPIKENNKLWGAGGRPSNIPHHKRQEQHASASSTSGSSSGPAQHNSSCTNGPDSRQCWTNGLTINTDFDKNWPDTDVTRKYELFVTNTTCNPDGTGDRYCLLVNDQLPGPTIWGNWGDTIEISVTNNLDHNGTSMHWHGVRQLNSVVEDGVNGITQCPLAPGDTQTYSWRATQYGTCKVVNEVSVDSD